MIKIMIADDQELIRESLRIVLNINPDMEVIGVTENGQETIDLIRAKKPDVILMDVRMPILDGVQCTRLIKEAYPEIRIIILTTFDDDEYVYNALKYGASGYLLKNIETDVLVDAIRRTAQGDSVVSQQMTAKLIQGVRTPPRVDPVVERDRFSPRERDILSCLAQGASNKEIARNLDLAESTVKIHVQNIFKKLNMSSRVQVALYAVEHGYSQAR